MREISTAVDVRSRVALALREVPTCHDARGTRNRKELLQVLSQLNYRDLRYRTTHSSYTQYRCLRAH